LKGYSLRKGTIQEENTSMKRAVFRRDMDRNFYFDKQNITK
jgi:hypothetical protein